MDITGYGKGVKHELHWLIRPPRRQLNSIIMNGFISLAFFLGSLLLGTNNPHVLPFAATVILLWTLADASLTNQFMYDKKRTTLFLKNNIKLKHVLIIRNLTIVILSVPLSLLFGLLMVAIVGKWTELIYGFALSLALVWGWLGICNVMSVCWPFDHMETKQVIKRQRGWLKFTILYVLPWILLPCYALVILLPLKVFNLISNQPTFSNSIVPVAAAILVSLIIWQAGLIIAGKYASRLQQAIARSA